MLRTIAGNALLTFSGSNVLPTVKSIVDLIGNQTPLNFNGGDYSLYFTVPVFSQNSLTFQLQRVPAKIARCYFSIEELLGDENLIPPNKFGFDVRTLQRHIATDSCRGFGVEMPEYGIIAYSGIGVYDRPIASVKEPNGTVKYFASPIISNLIKRM
jgi:hypothetical protein